MTGAGTVAYSEQVPVFRCGIEPKKSVEEYTMLKAV
jgi:hypothetical protein